MISVIVGDEDSERRLGHYELGTESSHPLSRTGRAYAGVDQDALALSFDHEAVTARPGAEDEHVHDEAHGGRAEGRCRRETRVDWHLAPPIVL